MEAMFRPMKPETLVRRRIERQAEITAQRESLIRRLRENAEEAERKGDAFAADWRAMLADTEARHA